MPLIFIFFCFLYVSKYLAVHEKNKKSYFGVFTRDNSIPGLGGHTATSGCQSFKSSQVVK